MIFVKLLNIFAAQLTKKYNFYSIIILCTPCQLFFQTIRLFIYQ